MDVNLALFVGRFHPLIVHLPIALVMVLTLVEGAALIRRQPLPAFWARLLLAVTAGGAVGAVACGWLLAGGGGYDPVLLDQHRWLGTAVAGLSIAALVVHALGRTIAYRVVLVATMAVLGAASHLGGSITHGTTYLTDYAPEPLRTLMGGQPKAPPKPAIEDPLAADVFADVVQPILAKSCLDCHGPGKQQGDLRLDSLEAVRKGGTNGPILVAGNQEGSELVRRLLLADGDQKRMPPAGRPGPAYDDIELLRWWIQAGAKDHATVGTLNPPGSVLAVLSERFKPAKPAVTITTADARRLADTLGKELGIAMTVTEVAQQPVVTVNARVVASFGDAELARLDPLAPVIHDLNLGGTKVTPAGLARVATMRELRALDLGRTGVDDSIATQVKGLVHLESLNLYGTKVTDAVLAPLHQLPRLRRLYVWQTQVTPAAAAAFATEQTDQRRIEDLHRRIDGLHRELARAKADVDVGPAASEVAVPKPVTKDAAKDPAKDPAKDAPKADAPKPVTKDAVPVATNTTCPVSGKPVDPTITRLVNGVVIAYCCPKCPPKNAKKP